MKHEEIIGVVGGVGPYTGLDLAKKIFDETVASTDQEHLDVAILSMPAMIADRTQFILGESGNNPASGICAVIEKLELVGARAVGIPCNSAHAPTIFDSVANRLKESASRVKLLNMIEETLRFVCVNFPAISKVGVLSTTGTREAGIYSEPLQRAGREVIVPDDKLQKKVHTAIYDLDFGVKAHSNPVTAMARHHFLDAIRVLRDAGAELIVLGCTEIPLAVRESRLDDTVLVDPTRILARALIREVRSDKLRPL